MICYVLILLITKTKFLFFKRYILVEEKKLRKLHRINDINLCVGGGGALRAGSREITFLVFFKS